MRKRIEYYKRDHWFNFALSIRTPWDNDCGDKNYNQLHVMVFGHGLWIKVPHIIKPRAKWVDTYNYSCSTPNKDGRNGYTQYIPKDYGFFFDRDAIHVYYGIQPGSWSSYDPKNSDHSKVFWWPWQLTIVRHDLLFPDGDVYWRNQYPKKDSKHLHWYEVFDKDVKSTDGPEAEVAKFIDLTHYTKDGRKQVAHIRLTGEEREWRPTCTRWLPFFKHTRRVVDCSSDVEIGEKAGSWKGGMMGWSCEWRHGESLKGAFWRWYEQWDGR